MIKPASQALKGLVTFKTKSYKPQTADNQAQMWIAPCCCQVLGQCSSKSQREQLVLVRRNIGRVLAVGFTYAVQISQDELSKLSKLTGIVNNK